MSRRWTARAEPRLNRVPRLQLLAAAALFSTGGAAIKAITLDGWQVAGFRSGIAALTVFLIVPAVRRRPGFRLWARDPRVLLVGAAYAATMVLFVLANKLTTAANSIFLQSTAPLYILLLGPWLLREPIRARDVLFIVVVGVALIPFFLSGGDASATAPDPARGNVIALASSVFWAFTVIGMRWLASSTPGGEAAFATVVAGNAMAFLVCLPFALPVRSSVPLDWVVIGYLGLFQIGLAYWCLTHGMRHVPALEASIILLLEPALNPIWAWLVHDERPSGWATLSGAFILGATLAKGWWDERSVAPSRPSGDPYAWQAPPD